MRPSVVAAGLHCKGMRVRCNRERNPVHAALIPTAVLFVRKLYLPKPA